MALLRPSRLNGARVRRCGEAQGERSVRPSASHEGTFGRPGADQLPNPAVYGSRLAPDGAAGPASARALRWARRAHAGRAPRQSPDHQVHPRESASAALPSCPGCACSARADAPRASSRHCSPGAAPRAPGGSYDHDVPGSGHGCRRIPLCPAEGEAAGCMMAIRIWMVKLWIMTSAAWCMIARSSPAPRTPAGGR